MSFAEKPPILTGNPQTDIANMRDWLFRFHTSLNDAAGAEISTPTAVSISHRADGQQVIKTGPGAATDIEAVRKNAQELKALIVKSAENLQNNIDSGDIHTQSYCDEKVEGLSSLYVAQSEYGTFKEEINTTIETTAKNTVESYGYGASIEALDKRTDSIQKYLTAIDGEIRRGIVEDPTTGEYVTGIAISQNLKFTGECGPADQHNPGDGYTYYYIDQHQTFGLYTSTGWQFWIDGFRRGWFNSLDNMLHVANIVVENVLQIGDSWQLRSSADGTEFEILYVGA